MTRIGIGRRPGLPRNATTVRLARISRRYMETNGLGSLLRIASLPKVPVDDLLAHALKDLPSHSVLITPFLTRDEVSKCLRLKKR